mmetsp:Transcript_32588/g.45213  ORF Transcript_32588/g.45213 Transcript_32588/m.45213 type:complete len:301 (+) Transcript_32588:51-953(+)
MYQRTNTNPSYNLSRSVRAFRSSTTKHFSKLIQPGHKLKALQREMQTLISPKLNILPDSSSAADALASLTAQAAAEAIESKGSFTVAVAGGSLINLLGGLKKSEGVQWDKWHVAWVDERCVPHSDPESNYGGALKSLLHDVPIPPSQIYAIDDSLYDKNEGAADPAAAAYDATLRGLPASVLPRTSTGLPVFDLLLLGFGPDGHICSLFPHHALLDHQDSTPWVLPIKNSPKSPPERVTFSLPVVNAAKKCVFVAVGEGKSEMASVILETAAKDGSIPAAMVQGNVEWIMDSAAASKLAK